MKTIIVVALIGASVYWFAFRPECGRSGALACPAPELEEGVGVALNAKETCPGSGYLCNPTHPAPFQVVRWPLDKGKLRVRVTLPDFSKGEAARQIQDAAIEGVMQWNNQPFPIVIQKGITFRWDIGVVWSQNLAVPAVGVANPQWQFNGKRVSFAVDGIGVVVPPPGSMPNEALLARVTAVASHEMGHALGIIWHSDRESDIMFASLNNAPASVSARDLKTIEALYALPNGARVE